MDQVRFEQNFRRIVMRLNALAHDARPAARAHQQPLPAEARPDQPAPKRRRRDR